MPLDIYTYIYMVKLKNILMELLDRQDSYPFKRSFSTEEIDHEDEDTGETYKKDVLSPVQIVKFKTTSNVPYIWYAKQSRYDPNTWSVAFGVDKGTGPDGANKLDIEKTGKGDAFKIFSTVIEITNSFVEFDDDNFEVQRISFESEGDNRTELYLKRLVPKLENFEVDHVSKSGTHSTVILNRKF